MPPEAREWGREWAREWGREWGREWAINKQLKSADSAVERASHRVLHFFIKDNALAFLLDSFHLIKFGFQVNSLSPPRLLGGTEAQI